MLCHALCEGPRLRSTLECQAWIGAAITAILTVADQQQGRPWTLELGISFPVWHDLLEACRRW